jgi:hypothetical protein
MPMRVKLFFASHPKAEHAQALTTCWPSLIRSSVLLLAADVLLHINGVDEKVGRSVWQAALKALPNTHKRLEIQKDNPGKQACGAELAGTATTDRYS